MNNRLPVRCGLLAILAGFAASGSFAATAAEEAEQLRIIGVMAEKMRERLDELPVLLPGGHALGQVQEVTVTLNQNAVVVEGQSFDGVVVTAPEEKSSFAWAFALPPNAASWYILRAQGDMKGFSNFLSRPRTTLPVAAATMQPTGVASITLQKLDSASWAAGERYVLWFRFKDATPTEVTLRAGFFAKASLNGNTLPALLFPVAE
jgi:hypothetical protein